MNEALQGTGGRQAPVERGFGFFFGLRTHQVAVFVFFFFIIRSSLLLLLFRTSGQKSEVEEDS